MKPKQETLLGSGILHVFSTDNGTTNRTSATLLSNKNLRCIVNDVDPELDDNFVLEELKGQFGIIEHGHIHLKRFMKNDHKLYTMMVTFNDRQDYEEALKKEQVLIGSTFCPIRKFKPKPYVIQCFKCQRFDHQAKWCERFSKSCGHCCSTSHESEHCVSFKNKKIEDLNCVNCHEKGKHSSLSKECPIYKNKLQYATSLVNDA